MTVLRRLGLRLRAAARGRISSITFLGWFLTAAAVAFGAAGSTLAGAAGTSCASAGYTVAPLHGTRFYVDASSSPALDSGYTGVSITPSAAAGNVWVKLSNFSGGALGLNANQPAALPLGNLAAGSTTPAYFFLTATTVGDVAAAQSFDVGLYQGDPGRGGTLLCTFGDGYSAGLMATIKAAANKVQDVTGDGKAATVSTSSPVVGGTVTLSVEGTTGTLGQGPDSQPFVYETPDALGSWPAGSFRLVGTTLTLSPGAGQTVYTNSLEIPRSTTAAQDYIVQYTFRITGTTGSATTPYPVQEISSGTQVKHTDPSSLASAIPAIQPPANTLTLTQSASAGSLPSSGGNVTYTATLHSSSSAAANVDEIVSTLPANGSYVTGSARLDGSAIGDPTLSGGTLVFPGPFAVSSAADRALSFTVTLPGAAGTYTDSTVGYVASTQIDTTTSTSDNAPASSSTTVAKTAQTIAFAAPADTRADQGPVSLSASASSGLAVSYASSTAGVCTVAGSSVTLLSAGTCTITASQPGDAQYAAAPDVSRSFVVTAAPLAQSIAFPQPADVPVDGGPVSLAATASSGLAVSYASSTPSVCGVSGASATLLATGTCTITASQAGNATYAAAADVSRSFAVTRAAQTIAFPQPADVPVDGGPVSLGATASSGLPVSYASSTPSVCTVAGSSVTLHAGGTCTITASQAGSGTYAAAADVPRSFAVATAAQTIAFAGAADTAVDAGPVVLVATASSGLAVSFTSNSPGVCAVSGSSVTLLATGTCSITASQPGDAAYAAALPVTRTFEVQAAAPAAPLAQTIAFPQPGDTRVDQGPVSLGATASSGLAVGYASATTSVCTVSGSSVTLVAAGTCTVTASQPGDGIYAAAADVQRSFAVTPAPQAISFPQPADTRVDQGPVALAATASSGLAVSFASSTTAVCTVSGTSATLVAAGTCTITATQAGDGVYAAAAAVTRSFEVDAVPVATPTAQTITFPQPADTRVDQGPVALSATASSSLPVGYASSTTSVCTVSGSSVSLVTAGACTITASQAGDSTYAAATDVSRTFQVTAAPSAPTPTAQSIAFPQPADTQVDQGPVSLGATASSGLTVSYASTTASVCSVSGASVSLLAAGTCSITAAQAGDSTYAAAAPVTRSFQVTAVPSGPTPTATTQSIAFPQPADTQLDRGPVSLGATASSGLAVSYASSTTPVCTVSGASVTLLAAGTCTITASQAGDSTHAAAADVVRSFQVTLAASPLPAPPVAAPPAPAPRPQAQAIAFAPVPPVDGGVETLTLPASATSGLPVGYDSATPAVCTVSAGGVVTVVGAGVCTIVARQAGDGGWLPAPDATLSFAVTPPPLPAPTTESRTTVAGEATRSLVGGVPAGASIALSGAPTLPGVAHVRIVGSSVVVTPATTFSGVVDVPIVVSKDGRTVETTVPVVVRPKAPTAVAVTPLARNRSEIAWHASASATGYVVRVDGRVVCTTESTSCTLPRLLSPSSDVVVTSLGHANTASDVVHASYAPRGYVLIAIVHFATASSALERTAKRILLSTESKIAKGRFTHAMLTCHTDSAGSFAYNMALSAARCAAVAGFVKHRLGISHVSYREASFAYLRPAAPNSTAAGMARNRRVEVYVR
ncbi:MAG TPA: hypothetical protein VFL60_08410 [Gaiellaceae bacterium]|nr:hypothetical protein [Gaiellaceae bacterium]